MKKLELTEMESVKGGWFNASGASGLFCGATIGAFFTPAPWVSLLTAPGCGFFSAMAAWEG